MSEILLAVDIRNQSHIVIIVVGSGIISEAFLVEDDLPVSFAGQECSCQCSEDKAAQRNNDFRKLR